MSDPGGVSNTAALAYAASKLDAAAGAVILDKPCLIVASTHRRVGLDRS